jgi:hypothetical protein
MSEESTLPLVGWVNLALKALFVGLLILGVVASDWPQFHGKAMTAASW